MLKLVAIAPADGWAFVQRNGETGLVKPPYTQSGFHITSSESAQIAVEKYGFESEDRDFPDWASLLGYLREMLAARRKGEIKHLHEFGPQVLSSAPRELKLEFLVRIRKELIPNREWDAALALLKALQHAEGTMEDRELRDDVLQLLTDCATSILRAEIERQEMIRETEQNLASRLPLLENVEAAKKLAEKVERKGQIFQVGAA